MPKPVEQRWSIRRREKGASPPPRARLSPRSRAIIANLKSMPTSADVEEFLEVPECDGQVLPARRRIARRPGPGELGGQPGDLVSEAFAFLPILGGEGGEDLGLGDTPALRGPRRLDLFGGEGTVVEPGALDPAAEQLATARGRMAEAEDDVALARLEREEAAG